MPKISKAQLLRALSAAEKTRPRRASPFQTILATPPRRLSSERAVNELVMSAFAKVGLDRKKLKQIRDQNKSELRRVIEKERREVIKRGSQAKANIKARIAGRRQALQACLVGPFAPPYLITLDKPFLIWASPHSNIIRDSHYQSWNSWARVNVASSGGFKHLTETLSFYFMWDNPSAEYPAVINVSASLGLWGDCQATAEGSFWHFYIGNVASLWLTGCLYPWEWWNQPPTLTQSAQADLGGVGAHSGLTEDSRLALLEGTYPLDAQNVVVAPGGTMVFEVAVAFNMMIIVDGSVHGAAEVTCPVVELSLLTAPPLQVVAGSMAPIT
jgi:hypothetical protein